MNKRIEIHMLQYDFIITYMLKTKEKDSRTRRRKERGVQLSRTAE
jgi:hypothetical protein